MHEKNKITFIGLRFFTVYGPYGRPDMGYFIFADSIKNYKTIKLHNGGEMLRDMTYIDDIVQGISKAISYANSKEFPIIFVSKAF